MTYVDGFVAAVPTANREIYKSHAEISAVFKKHGIEARRVLGETMCPTARSPRFRCGQKPEE